MVRNKHPDSAGSQFFLMHKDSSHLDGQYAAFGKIVEGIEKVDKIADTKTGRQDRPKEDQIMETVTVDLNGYEYEAPETL